MLIEIKKAHNGRFWNGLEGQLPSYLTSDACNEGWFIAVRYRNNRASEQRMRELPQRVRQVEEKTGKSFHYGIVDARPPVSASNIEPEMG